MGEINTDLEREEIEKIKIKKIFVLDEDGIFKEFFPERILAPFSNFLSWEERKKFFLRGEIPKRLENIFREIQNAKAAQIHIEKKGEHPVKISLEVRKSILGLDITCYIYKSIYKKLKKKKGGKGEQNNEEETASERSGKGELVIFMTQPQPKITIITDENMYGDEKILRFFIARQKEQIHDRT